MSKSGKPSKAPKSARKDELATDEDLEVMDAASRILEMIDPAELEEILAAEDDDEPLSLPVQRLPHAAGLALPERQSEGASGFDLQAAVSADAPLVIQPGARALVPTGFCYEIPPGFEGQVRPRSGLALKHGVTVLNAPGTIDSDYRGEVKVLLINHGDQPFTVSRGDRVAQMVICGLVPTEAFEDTVLNVTSRGEGGFGSTGKSDSGKRRGKE